MRNLGTLFHNPFNQTVAHCMNNNGIFRRLRYTLDFNNSKIVEVFGLVDQIVTVSEIKAWLKFEDDPTMVAMPDVLLASFLNGLIIEKRGKKEGAQPIPEAELTNNLVLRKLRIAFDLKTDEMLDIFELVDKGISPHELSSFFRKPTQSKYRVCNDQYLRFFLKGLQKKYRGSESD